jgi:hypothetical protein
LRLACLTVGVRHHWCMAEPPCAVAAESAVVTDPNTSRDVINGDHWRYQDIAPEDIGPGLSEEKALYFDVPSGPMGTKNDAVGRTEAVSQTAGRRLPVRKLSSELDLGSLGPTC